MSNEFGVREGEIAVDLPAKTDAGLYYIGRIRTPWKQRKDCPKNARESDAVCTVELDPRWTEGLKDVATCSHIILLYWMDKSPRNLVRQVPGHYGVPHGTFALRSPARPNPIAMSVVKLLRIAGGTLSAVSYTHLDPICLISVTWVPNQCKAAGCTPSLTQRSSAETSGQMCIRDSPRSCRSCRYPRRSSNSPGA